MNRNHIVIGWFLILLSGCQLISDEPPSIIWYPVQDPATKQWGYVNTAGQWVVQPQFASADFFSEARAAVALPASQGRRWGFINREGKVVIPPLYAEVLSFSDGLAWSVLPDSFLQALQPDGQERFSLPEALRARPFSARLAPYETLTPGLCTKRWGYVNIHGQKVIPPRFHEAFPCSQNRCAVQGEQGRWGYINTAGQLVIPFQFRDATPFVHGVAVVATEHQRVGVIDTQGQWLIPPKFDFLIPASVQNPDLFIALVGTQWGIWDRQQKAFIINPQFKRLRPAGTSLLFPATKDGRYWGYINTEGGWVIQPQFDEAFPFWGNVAIVKIADRYGLIDEQGRLVVNPIWTDFPSQSFILHVWENVPWAIAEGIPVELAWEVAAHHPRSLLSCIDYVDPLGGDFCLIFSSTGRSVSYRYVSLTEANVSPDKPLPN